MLVENNWDHEICNGNIHVDSHNDIKSPYSSELSVPAEVSSIWIKIGTFPISLLEDDV